jgi:hypothetical protein
MLALAAVNDTVFLMRAAATRSGASAVSSIASRSTPFRTTPLEVLPIGPFLDGNHAVTGVTGMTFRSDGTLWMIDEHDHGLFTVDRPPAHSTRIARMVESICSAGDITFDTAGDDVAVEQCTVESRSVSSRSGYRGGDAAHHEARRPPGRACRAALRQRDVMGRARSRCPVRDPIPSGFTGFQPLLVFNGAGFDHKRGDLARRVLHQTTRTATDANPCTTDTCRNR